MENTLSKLFFWYTKQAQRTYSFQEEVAQRMRNIQIGGLTLTEDGSQRLMHGILGMSGEAGEIAACNNEADHYEDSLQKEIGDWMWYFVIAASALGTPIEKFFAEGVEVYVDDVAHITISSSIMIEGLKKWLYYGKPMNQVEIEKALANACAWIWIYAECSEEVMKEILEGNIAKLQKRFPTKFTAADAIARVDA